MTQESRLVIAIDSRSAEDKAADLEKALQALEAVGLKATKSVGSAGDAFAKTGSEASTGARGVDKMGGALGDTDAKAKAAMSTLKSFFAAATAGVTAMSAIDAADQWGQYASRIKMTTESAEEYAYVQSRMASSANDTYRSINETREAFINLSPVIRDMGYTLTDSINAVDTFSGLLVVNGANAERGAAAMSALSKSLQKGKVDADAWSTIYSTADTITESLARSTGKTTEEIRKLGAAGKLSAQQIVAALTGDYQRVMGQVEKMPTTVRDALQKLGNNFTELAGRINESTQTTAGLASALDSISDYIGSEDFMAGAIEGFTNWSSAVDSIASDLIGLQALISDLTGDTIQSSVDIGAAFSEMPANIRAMVQIAVVEISSFIDAQLNGVRALAEAIKAIPQGPSAASDAFDAVRAEMENLGRLRQDSIDYILQERDAILEAGRVAAQSYRDQRNAVLSVEEVRVRAAAGEAELTKEQEKSLKARQKALADFTKQMDLSIASTNNLAAAYLKGADAVEEAQIQQKIEAEVLKQGEKQRAAITKSIREQDKALKSLDLSKNIADMRNQNKELAKYGEALLAGGEATKAGRDALADYNDQRELEAALVGKTAAEIKQLIPLLKAEQAERRSLNERNAALEELNALVIETRTEQEKANAAFEHLDELSKNAKTPEHLEAIRRKTIDVQKQTSIWAKLTEGAVDRIDSAFADMWKGVLDGSKDVWDGLKDGLKQTLAEMLHMLTTKPLLQSFSDWISGTSSGQGIGDVLGRVFGGGGGSSSGGGFGNIIDIAKNIYSVYDSLTGVVPAAWGGFQSGGLSGGLSAIGNYYGGMLSNAYSSIASWFGGAATTAATTAATSAATSAAANVGYGLGQQLVSGQIGSLTYAAGSSAASGAGSGVLSGIGSNLTGMLTNPWGWVTAGVIASWKLHDAGVRNDPKVLDKAWGDTSGAGSVLKEITMVNARIAQVFDKIAGSIVGEKFNAISSGSPLIQFGHQLVARLFGSGEKFKTTVGSAVGQYVGGEYTGLGAAQNHYNGARRFGDDIDAALHDLNEAFSVSLGGLFEKFDIDDQILTDARVRLRRTSGKLASDFYATIGDQMLTFHGQYAKGGNIQLGLEQFFDAVMGEVFSKAIGVSKLPEYLKELTGGLKKAEEVNAALTGLFQRFDGANAVIENLGLSAFELSDKGLRAADAMLNMSAAMAGLENPTSLDKVGALSKMTEAYIQGFVPQSEQFANSMKQLRSSFEALDQTMPGSRKGFMDLVKALDLNTEEGRTAFATYMSLSEAMGNYYTSMEQLESGYLQSFGTVTEQQAKALADLQAEFSRLGVALPDSKEGFRTLVDGIDVTTTAGQDLRTQLLSLVPAMSSYIGMLDEQKTALKEQQDVIAAQNAARLAASDSIASGLGGLREQIFLDQLGTNESKYGYYKSQADSLAQLLPALTDLGAIQDVSNRITSLYSSAYGLLDEEGKRTRGSEYLAELEKLQNIANEQVRKSQEEATATQARAIEEAFKKASQDMAADMDKVFAEGVASQSRVANIIQATVDQFSYLLSVQLRGQRGMETTG